MRADHDKLMAVTVGSKPPIVTAIHHEDDSPDRLATDSGFTLLYADAPNAWELTEDDDRLKTICLHCLIERHPEVGRGLDLAKIHGSAERYPDVAGEWFGRHPDTGEWFGVDA